MTVAKGCSNCIHAGNDFAWAMRMACSAVAVPKDTGSQRNATARTSNAPLGVSLRQFADSQRDHNQRHDNQVLDACAGRAFRYGPVVAGRAKVDSWLGGRHED